MTEFERALKAAWESYSYQDSPVSKAAFTAGFRAGWDASMEVSR